MGISEAQGRLSRRSSDNRHPGTLYQVQDSFAYRGKTIFLASGIRACSAHRYWNETNPQRRHEPRGVAKLFGVEILLREDLLRLQWRFGLFGSWLAHLGYGKLDWKDHTKSVRMSNKIESNDHLSSQPGMIFSHWNCRTRKN